MVHIPIMVDQVVMEKSLDFKAEVVEEVALVVLNQQVRYQVMMVRMVLLLT